MLPVEQIQAAEHGLDPTNLGGARGLKRRAQWPGGIVPYTIHSSASMIRSFIPRQFFRSRIVVISVNRPYSYIRFKPGTSLQLRLWRGIVSNANDS